MEELNPTCCVITDKKVEYSGERCRVRSTTDSPFFTLYDSIEVMFVKNWMQENFPVLPKNLRSITLEDCNIGQLNVSSNTKINAINCPNLRILCIHCQDYELYSNLDNRLCKVCKEDFIDTFHHCINLNTPFS